jgi:cytidylate kinase
LDKEASSARNQDVVKTVGEVIAKNRFREEIDAQRYLKLYGVDHRRLDNYDLIVNTTEISAAQAADKIIDYLNRVRKENGQNKIA